MTLPMMWGPKFTEEHFEILNKGSFMNRAFLLGSLFLRVTAVYGAETHGHLILEGRKRNEEAYEKSLKQTGWRNEESPPREQKAEFWPPTISPQNLPKQVAVTDRQEAIPTSTR
jgi:hypothetical protein